MPARDVHTQQLTLEARKHLLLVACTLDRIELASHNKPVPGPVRVLSQLAHLPWLDTVLSLAMRALPRRLRFLGPAWRMLRARRH